MSQDSDLSSTRETLRRQIAQDHGFALYKHYSERDAAAFLRLHPVTLKKLRLAGSIGYISKGRRAIAYFGFQIADYLIDQVRPCRATPNTNFQVGEWWLSQRSGSPAWYATFYDAAAKRTRRVSLGTDDFEQARQRLLERYLEEHRPQNAPAETVALADIVLDYYKTHGSEARSAGSIRTSCAYWVDFFGEASIAEATKPPRLEAFIAHLAGQGFATAYIQRILGVGKAALQRAWQPGRDRGRALHPERQGRLRRAAWQALEDRRTRAPAGGGARPSAPDADDPDRHRLPPGSRAGADRRRSSISTTG